MIQRVIIEEVRREPARPGRGGIKAAYISMQKEMGTMRVWATLDSTHVVDLARIFVHPFTDLEHSEYYSYLKELKEVGPTTDMHAWATLEPVSNRTRWYVEVVIPNAD